MHHIKWFCYTRKKGVLGLKQKRSLRTIITALALSVTFVTGCARRATIDDEDDNNPLFTENSIIPESNVETVSVAEPFYNSSKIVLDVNRPLENIDGNFRFGGCDDPMIVGDHIIVRTVYSLENVDSEEYYQDFCLWNVFDLQGNYVTYLEEDFLPTQTIFHEDKAGNFIAVYADYSFSDDEWIADISVARFDKDGHVIVEPAYLFSDKFSEAVSMVADDNNGEIFVATKHKIVQVDPNGEVMSSISFDYDEETRCLWEEDGEFYMQTTQDDSNGTRVAMIYKIEIGPNGYFGLGAAGRDATNLLSMKMYQTNTGIYASTRNALGKLDFSSGDFSSFLDWNQTDIDRSTVFFGNIKVLSEGSSSQPVKVMEAAGSNEPVADVTDAPRSDYSDADANEETCIAITAMEYVDESMKPTLYLLSPADENPHEGQDVLWVGGIGISSSSLMTSIARYNDSNSQNIWIKVYDYAGFEYDKPLSVVTETQQALEKMAAQVSSGMGPDIIIGAGETGLFDNGRALTDLNAYVDGISGLDRRDYFDSVLSAFETDGKLYQIPLAFTVQGLLGNKSMVGGRPEMNYYDFNSAREYLSEDIALFNEMTAEELCNILVEGETGTWINYSNDSVSIDREALKDMIMLVTDKLIKDCNEYGWISNNFWYSDTITYDPNLSMTNESIFLQRAAFEPSTINSIKEYAQTAIYPDLLSWYGYPGGNGQSLIAQSDMSVGISASSTQKEKAWEVIKYFLNEDNQVELGRSGFTNLYGSEYYVPLNREAFRTLNEEVNESPDVFTYAFDENYNWVEFYAGEKDEIIKNYEMLLDSPMRRYIRDPEVIMIVRLAIGRYYNGEISLDETADVIIKEITDYIER